MNRRACPPDLDRVLQLVLENATANLHSIHGLEHWARVERNGIWLAERTGADVTVIRLFALLHDSMRLNDHHDPGHGPRAAELAASLGAEALGITASALDVLCEACTGHTRGRITTEPTIAACWDADRLDLPRAGITPRPRFFSTPHGRCLAACGNLSPLRSVPTRPLY